MSVQSGKRNMAMDAARGIAIFLVIMGHIIENRYSGFQGSVFFNIIWTLQMPIFFVISGFFCKGNLPDATSLFKKIGDRFLRLMVPYLAYFYLVELIIFGQHNRNIIEATKALVFNIQYSLWFLFVNFILSVMFLLIRYIQQKWHHGLWMFLLLYGAFCIPLALVAFLISPNLFGVKFVLYYSFYFVLGMLVSDYKEQFVKIKPAVSNAVSLCAFVFFFYAMNHFEMINITDTVMGIALRVSTAIMGIHLLFTTLNHCLSCKAVSVLAYLGSRSLELYIASCVIMKYFASSQRLYSASEIPRILLFGTLITLLSYVLIVIIKSNVATNTIFFGYLKKKTEKEVV